MRPLPYFERDASFHAFYFFCFHAAIDWLIFRHYISLLIYVADALFFWLLYWLAIEPYFYITIHAIDGHASLILILMVIDIIAISWPLRLPLFMPRYIFSMSILIVSIYIATLYYYAYYTYFSYEVLLAIIILRRLFHYFHFHFHYCAHAITPLRFLLSDTALITSSLYAASIRHCHIDALLSYAITLLILTLIYWYLIIITH